MFTQGPWKVSANGCDVENAEGAGVCAMYADETSKANAALIAACPALVEACEAVIATYNTGDEHEAYKLAKAALALAKGGGK